MSRPDPLKVARRPMARGHRVATAAHREDGAGGPLFDGPGTLDINALHHALGSAQSVVEGCEYGEGGDDTFLGSVALSLVLDSDADAQALASALSADPRAHRAVCDRIYRELSRLLQAQTPAHFEADFTTRVDGTRVRIVADIEAPMAQRVATA